MELQWFLSVSIASCTHKVISHIYPAVEGHPLHKQSTGNCHYIPRVGVRKQGHWGKSH